MAVSKKLEIYTDGACSGNGNKSGLSAGGYSVVVVKDDEISITKGFSKVGTTNNEMELMGVLTAIKLANSVIERNDEFSIEIYSDSSYVVNSINLWMAGWAKNNWIKPSDKKPPENLEIMQEIYSLMEFKQNKIKITKVKGHSGNEFNEIADKIAVAYRDRAKVELERTKK